MKTPVLASLFNKVAGLQTSTQRLPPFRDSNTDVSCGYYKLFENSVFIEKLRRLLLKVLPQYSEVG